MVGALLLPVVGVPLAFGLLAIGAFFYQGAIDEAGAFSDTFGSGSGREEIGGDDGGSAAALALRIGLAVLASLAFVAPFAIRNGGRLLIGDPRHAGSFSGMLAALGGWAVLPIVLVCAHARDRRGPIPVGFAARTLTRHPIATLLALALVPLGVVAVELFVASLAIEQGVLSLFITDLFPTPGLEFNANGTFHRFNYDGVILRDAYAHGSNLSMFVYFAALRHGHTLCADLPFSLATPWQSLRMDPSFYQLSAELYLAIRCVFSALIFITIGVFLSIQARCLGVIAAIDAALPSRRRIVGGTTAPVVEGSPRPPPIVSIVETAGDTFVSAGLASNVAPSPAASALATARLGPPGAPRILIIDDERAFAHAIAKILVSRGFTVTTAGDAAEGQRLAHSFRPDLIVLDLLLPDRPGMDLCRDLRASAETRDVSIVVATYKAGADDEILVLTQGADDYLAKPYVVEVLIVRIQKQLRNRRV